jgi:hypothetical protein
LLLPQPADQVGWVEFLAALREVKIAGLGVEFPSGIV